MHACAYIMLSYIPIHVDNKVDTTMMKLLSTTG